MTMTISGDGTITGLVAGGLPDATVTAADLATEATPVGVGQTWQAVTRVNATQYTNTTGRPITVYCTFSASASVSVFNFTIGGYTLPGTNAGTGETGNATAVVPTGSTYTCNVSGSGTLSITVAELR